MDVSSSTDSIVANYLSQRDRANEVAVQVALLRMAQNQMKLEGTTMLELIDQSAPAVQSPLPLLDRYA